jgi:hypothetical protein
VNFELGVKVRASIAHLTTKRLLQFFKCSNSRLNVRPIQNEQFKSTNSFELCDLGKATTAFWWASGNPRSRSELANSVKVLQLIIEDINPIDAVMGTNPIDFLVKF